MVGLFGTSLQFQPIITDRNQFAAEPFSLDRPRLSPFCSLFYDWLKTIFAVPYKTSAWTRHKENIQNTVSIVKVFTSFSNGLFIKNLSPRERI
jgi:hypothetical protein